ncbi:MULTISPECIES: SAM-dependent methyltransferase [Kitasatospora]|uniref:SAM-dependent methyltransferase n=1 Tax=Kitasatospora cathayae TaxID=3004092 RepID=A0ABY7QF00_9ACTN|nr:SAM-dependent methyltransferase [Kitasatospora sp. HUAS 3-15]WBP91121.1 SAM-dependent methyltransferase [Kitasatospora sp. HUAS 3-15]
MTATEHGPAQPAGPRIRQDIPHSARMYDYFLGGKDNFAVDREAAERVLTAFPTMRTAVRANRTFMHRATRALARRGLRQWLDIGTGIPTSPNLHEVAQAVEPSARVVYADNDPVVLAHSRALMTSTPQGRTAYVHGDVRDPAAILTTPQVAQTLDLTRPVVLSMIALLHFVPDLEEAHAIVRHLLDPLPAGSALVLSHATAELDPPGATKVEEIYNQAGTSLRLRPEAEFATFFEGLDLLDPGIVPAHRWHPEGTDDDADPLPATVTDAQVSFYAAVALKP